ncbi:restriction endonuclease [Frankia sp. AiPa1]|uniref:restriction endonuclease n=1 Tax=Frankia sp. AiPa1 TaxID=573492 RepID=UPI00202B5E02|nr:restriction endonuclease [Frankia sp. AiPa1]MCL9759190.1 restriction endonuclease [Frankia sp. AiPa1]
MGATSLAISLYIPPNTKYEINLLHVVKNVPSPEGRTRQGAGPTAIEDWSGAEIVAASWLRRLGYPDAQVTPPGTDGGVDVFAVGAVAQVKWEEKKAGIRYVQRLVGSSSLGQDLFFFSKTGYTAQALKWSQTSEHRVALFIMRPDGDLDAANRHARDSLALAPSEIPAATPIRPISVRVKLSMAVPLLVIALFDVSMIPVALITSPGASIIFLLVLTVPLFLLSLWSVIAILEEDLRRFVNAIRQYRRTRVWAGWKNVLRANDIPEARKWMPPDYFPGFDRHWSFKLYRSTRHALSGSRIARRRISAARMRSKKR